MRGHLQEWFYHITEFVAVNCWYFGLLAAQHLPLQALHVFRPKGRFQGTHLLQNTPETPNITLAVLRLVTPHFWRGILRRASLCVQQTLFGHLGHVHVAQFATAVLVQEYIRTLNVPMEYIQFMECFESIRDLDEYLPDFLLFEERILLLVLAYFFEEIPVVCLLHYNTQGIICYECFFVHHYGWWFYGCDQAYFVYRILFFFVREVWHFYFL